jgi:hypothetical protein
VDLLISTIFMSPDATLELPLEQLIGVSNKKLFVECAGAQSAMPPTFAAEARSQERGGNLEYKRCALQVDALEKQARDWDYFWERTLPMV